MKVALAQLNYTVGAIKSNKYKIINSIYKAKEKGAELVVFSEFAVSGTHCYDLINKVPFIESCEVALVEIASHCDDIAVIVGLPMSEDNARISVAAVIENRRIVKIVGKKNIPRNDKVFFSPSKGMEYVTIKGKKVAVVVGEDILLQEKVDVNTDLVVAIYADRYSIRQIANRYDYFKTFAFLSGKPVVFINHFGGQSEAIYDGSSFVCNSRGKHIALLKSFEEDFVVADTEGVVELEEPEQNITANVFRAIKLGLTDYFGKNGFKKACLGLSGGIDSAVVLAMAVESLGAENVRVLMMPSKFSSDHSVKDAVQMAEGLNVEYDIIPINDTYETILKSLEPIIGETPFGLTEENIQARIRCDMLMALANKHGYILLNTSNKSEASMGYGTLYGDLAGSLGVIADLYKIDVYSLARYINREKEIIPRNIIEKEPSAELRPNQKDSDSLPPYEVLDAILYRFIEVKHNITEILNAGFTEEQVDFVLEGLKKNEFKRRQSCPALWLSIRPYGSGFILPLLNRYVLHIED